MFIARKIQSNIKFRNHYNSSDEMSIVPKQGGALLSSIYPILLDSAKNRLVLYNFLSILSVSKTYRKYN